jgi:hypothetical protein
MTLSRRVGSLVLTAGLLVTGSFASAADVTGALTFIGITPCRIADTRGGGGTFTGQAGPPALVAGATRTFQITGTVPGVPTQCGIPSNAAAISVNFTVAGFTGPGDVRVFPAGGSVPNASIVNYALENVANATTVPLGPVSSEKGITVQADVSSTQLVIDVNGYYVARPITITLTDSEGSTTSTTPVVISSIYAANFRSQGHTQGRLVARWNNSQQSPASTGTITARLVQRTSCSATTGGTVLTSITQGSGYKAWLDYSPTFSLPSTSATGCLDLEVSVTSGTGTWRVIELELTR